MTGRLTTIFLFIFSVAAYGQVDSVGPGHALRFDGVHDYVTIGDKYHDLNFPFTISAWVFLDPTSGAAPIFVTNDNNPLYRGFWFTISPGALQCEFGDGTGGDNPAFRQGKIALIQNMAGRWINVCAVMTSPSLIDLYINGINIGGGPSGESGLSMASSFSGDTPKIGYFLSNGVTYHFKGMMDEIRLYNRSLTPAEVRQGMCKKMTGTELGLIGYWNLDETSGTTILDKSSNGFDGQMQGNPQRVFSGAPVGNESTYLYPTTGWANTTLSMTDGMDQVNISNVLGNPEGIQLYVVKNLPSQTDGINLSQVSPPYFGIFIASLDNDNRFDVDDKFQNAGSCRLFSRNDNSAPTWLAATNPSIQVLQRIEVVKIASQPVNFDLGSNKVLCNQPSTTLSTGLSDPNLTFQWNNGMNTSAITVSQSGEYVVKVSGACGTVSDSVKINFVSSPPSFSLGENRTLCNVKPISLIPLNDSTGFVFTWQDGSHFSTYLASSPGTYWVAVSNACGQTVDSLTLFKRVLDISKLPNVITPNDDGKNDFYKVPDEFFGELTLVVFNRWGKKVFQEDGYVNDWNGGELDGGVYFLLLTGGCIDRVKDSLTVLK